MMQRERQTDWLADLTVQHAAGRPCRHPGAQLQAPEQPGDWQPRAAAAPAARRARPDGRRLGPVHRPARGVPARTAPVLLHRHPPPRVPQLPLEPGSVVVDPWRYVESRPDVEVVRIGGARG